MRYDQLHSMLESISQAEKSIESSRDTAAIMQRHLQHKERIKKLICVPSGISNSKQQARKVLAPIRPIPNGEAGQAEKATTHEYWRAGTGSSKRD